MNIYIYRHAYIYIYIHIEVGHEICTPPNLTGETPPCTNHDGIAKLRRIKTCGFTGDEQGYQRIPCRQIYSLSRLLHSYIIISLFMTYGSSTILLIQGSSELIQVAWCLTQTVPYLCQQRIQQKYNEM